VSPSLFFLLVVDTVAVLQAFTQIHLLTRGGPVDATRTLVYSIYLDAFQNFQFGFASAESVVLFVLIMALTIIQFRFVERLVTTVSGRAAAIGRTETIAAQRRRPLPIARPGPTSCSPWSRFCRVSAPSRTLVLVHDRVRHRDVPAAVLPAHPSLDNYEKVLATIPIGATFLNSFIVSTAVVIGQLVTASLAAYAFSFLVSEDGREEPVRSRPSERCGERI